MITYDRQGKMWQQWEGGFDWYKRKPGMKWIEGVPEQFWSWTHVHAFDMQSGSGKACALLDDSSGAKLRDFRLVVSEVLA